MPFFNSQPILPPDPVLIAGPIMIGVNLNFLLYGALIVQYYIYCTRFQADKSWIKILVHLLFILETVQTIMSMYDVFHWLVLGFWDKNWTTNSFLFNIDALIINAIIAFIAHGAYLWRIWCITKSSVCCSAIAVAALSQLVGGLGVGITKQGMRGLNQWSLSCEVLALLWCFGSAIADTIISIMMIFLLVNQSDSRTNRAHILAQIVRVSVTTNAATTIVSTIQVIFLTLPIFAVPRTGLYLCPSYFIGKLYSNSFMTVLINRYFINQDQSGTTQLEPKIRPAVNNAPDLSLPENDLRLCGSSPIG